MLQYKQENNLYLIAIFIHPIWPPLTLYRVYLQSTPDFPGQTLRWNGGEQRKLNCLQEKGNTIIGGRESRSIVDLHCLIHFCSFNARFFYLKENLFHYTLPFNTLVLENWELTVCLTTLLDNNNRYNEIQQIRRHMPCNIPTH